MRHSVLLASFVACLAAVAVCDDASDLFEHMRVSSISLEGNLAAGDYNYRIRRRFSLTTRLYDALLPGGDLLVGWTDDKSVGHVSYLKRLAGNRYTLKKTLDIKNRIVRGIAALPDTSFGVLAWKDDDDEDKTQMFVQGWTAMSGEPSMMFETELKNLDGDTLDNRPTDFGIGESRMSVDAGDNYYVYYHVHSLSGHEGDTYFSVNTKTGTAKRIWRWGCSHSMSNLLSFHPSTNKTLSLCVTDCYPGTSGEPYATNAVGGLYTENRNLLQVMGGGCNGCVGGEVGMVAPVHEGGWVVIFNSHRNDVGKGTAACAGKYIQDVGLAFVDESKKLSGSVKWLTQGSDDVSDPALARYGEFADGQNFLVGWKRSNSQFIGLMDKSGKVTKGPFNVTSISIDGVPTTVSWGARDDTWRTLDDGSVVWLEAPSKNEIRVFVMQYGDFPDLPSSDPDNPSDPENPSAGVSLHPCGVLLLAVLLCILSFF